jgi:glycosyltransferase involved in cell wall biosynthesis
VNYSPYENSGKILDYILENFQYVYLFSIGFHNLVNKRSYNNLTVYKEGKCVEIRSLFQIPVGSKLVFLMIPLRSIISFLEIFTYSIWIARKFSGIDVYFSANAFTSWIGMLLKAIKIVKKTVFWVWDYYPPVHENRIVMIMRWIYWQFDKISSHSDIVAFVNHRLLNLRVRSGIYRNNKAFPIVPIGTDKLQIRGTKRLKKKGSLSLGFIGVLKKSQGVEMVFRHAKALKKVFGAVRYEIVGSGPDEHYFRDKADRSGSTVTFYGYVEEEQFNEILGGCDIGIAMYTPDDGNVSQYGDPGKIKRYLSLGLPVITTNILEISKEIESTEAGVVVEYGNQEEFVRAVKKIMLRRTVYSRNAYLLSQKYYYKTIYPKMFAGI